MPISLVLCPTSSAPTASASTATSAFIAGWVHDLAQKKFQKISSICIVLREKFAVSFGVFAQSELSREYLGCFLGADAIHQVDKVDVRASDGLKYP